MTQMRKLQNLVVLLLYMGFRARSLDTDTGVAGLMCRQGGGRGTHLTFSTSHCTQHGQVILI